MWLIVLLSLALGFFAIDGQAQKPTADRISPDQRTTRVAYHTVNIDGLDIFYREAGDPSKPTILLLHGFPASSHMFRNLIPALADRFHLVAPDYPGFGQSSAPSVNEFNYTFDNLAGVIDKFTDTIGLKNYSLYVQDYGAPVGYRLALKHPERVTALVIQNGNAYEDGLKDFWNPIKAYWADGSQQHREALRVGLTLEATKSQYIKGVRDVSRISPDTWLHDQTLLGRPGIDEIMLDLFKDYGSNVALYPQFQQFFRTRRPPTLIVWGQNDEIFPADGAYGYLHDLPNAKLYLLDTGHFALEDKGDEIAMLMRDFLDRWLPGK
ncbi:MAG: alpha/beta hydrolase [Nitrospira sp. ST-bin4]|nr:MAG: alpha/beta hydrolase [Nitrospira sp. SG-bin2]OQW59744.1 MAG: alpha/beta hydrolase [Nitrospira sp. ST-bin4]